MVLLISSGCKIALDITCRVRPVLWDNGAYFIKELRKKMKNRALKRIIAALLALTMVCSVLSVAAFAAQNELKKANKTYDVYTVVGDSIAAGYGLSENPDSLKTQFTLTHGELVEGSYPVLLGKAVNAKKINQHSRDAYTLAAFMRFLDEDYEHELNMPENYWQRFLTDCNYFQPEIFKPGDFADQKATFKNSIKEADLITINLGNNDIALNGLLSGIYKFLYYSFGMSAQAAFSALEGDFNKAESLDQLFLMVSRGNTDGLFKSINEEMDIALKQYEVNYDRFIKAIRKVNPNAEIYTVGMYDTFREAEPQGSVIQKYCSDTSVKVCNQVADFLQNESSVRSEYTYVDDTYTHVHPSASMYSPSFLLHYLVHCHPDYEGHTYIANQIIDAINANHA